MQHVNVSVPFSMGTVLLLLQPGQSPRGSGFSFSPLLDGDGVASTHGEWSPRFNGLFQSPSRWGRCCFAVPSSEATARRAVVSVPFSMGTVLLRDSHELPAASHPPFQSPSRWGRCCFALAAGDTAAQISPFQSPSRWGRCCFNLQDANRRSHRPFQSPSRWGRCCYELIHWEASKPSSVSVPFSMGTVLLPSTSARRRKASRVS